MELKKKYKNAHKLYKKRSGKIKYKNYKKILKKVIKLARHKYYEHLIEATGCDTRRSLTVILRKTHSEDTVRPNLYYHTLISSFLVRTIN